MSINTYKLILPILSAAAASVILTGCGPGFPIMTREQETLEQNVNTLLKENAALKKRMDSISGGGPASLTEINRSLDEIKKTAAETSLGLDQLRQDFSFVQGRLDESGHEGEKEKDSIKSVSEGLRSADAKFADLGAHAAETDKKLAALYASIEAQTRTVAEVKGGLQSLETRTTSLEGRLSGQDGAPRASQPRHESKPEPEALYLKGYQEVVDKNYAAASETLGGFLAEYPDHKFAGNAQYWIGEISYARGDWEKAILEFDKAIKKYPASEKTAASLLKQGFAFEKIGSKKESRLLLGSVIEKFPKSPEAGMARKKLDSMK
jgi:tol-pal system protein YbgF